MKSNILFLLLILIIGCNSENFIKIEDNELIQRMVDRSLPEPDSIQIKDSKGNILSTPELVEKMNSGEYYHDFYKDQYGNIVLVIIRQKTDKDEKILKEIDRKLNELEELELVNVDCNELKSKLDSIYLLDQGMRQEGKNFDPNIDKSNLQQIISIIEQCGMPNILTVEKKGMNTIWLVIQHGSRKYRKKYLPELEKAVKNGDLELSHLAMMNDRILMDENKPQKYGSQIQENPKTGKFELYNLENPEYVNKRRKEVGFNPIEEYLEKWDIEFNIPQKE